MSADTGRPGWHYRLLREPLLHFLILGALLFAAYGWLQRGRGAVDEIVVSRGQLDSLRSQFARTRQRPPSADEMQGLIDAWVREEVFFREGSALGLDRDDAVVRRRVAQKVEFLADGMVPAAPTDAELQAWLDAHRADYRVDARYSLRQVYFDPARRGVRLEGDVAAALVALQRGQSAAGDSTLLPGSLSDTAAFEVERSFGKGVAAELDNLPVGSWAGPVRSGFGLHLVNLSARQDARDATLAEVRDAVQRDLLHARGKQADAAFYKRLRDKYSVRIEAANGAAGLPTRGAP